MPTPTLDTLRRHALARSLFAPTTLPAAIRRLGFVQADPLRAPARAQDLTLRHRVAGYRAGDLERRYATLAIEEDFFVNYGFVPRATHHLMHPRTPRTVWTKARWKQAHAVLDFVRERGVVHPREVDAALAHGKVVNAFGGSSNASTQLLDALHYRGLLRVARRDAGVRLYAPRDLAAADAADAAPPQDTAAAHDALADVAIAKYAPLPQATLGLLMSRLSFGVPQWRGERAAVLKRAKARLAHARIDGVDWFWPAADRIRQVEPEERVRLLAPFDPVVWDRCRFELFWGWAYRFEAYTPAPQRQFGHYALPMLWRDRVIGWGNVSLVQGNVKGEAKAEVQAAFGYVAGRAPREAAFRRELEAEVQRLREFLQPMSG